MGNKLVDLTDKRVGHWTVIQKASRKGGTTYWMCACDCGNWELVSGYTLRSGRSRSCGCARASLLSAAKTLAIGPTTFPAEARVYRGMKTRCQNPRDPFYRDYGGRGISICPRWLGRDGFSNFMSDMGPRPSKKHSIERKDFNGNYEPGNCRWATQAEQSRNHRRTIFVEVDGQRMCLKDFCDRKGLPYSQVYQRMRLRGWSLERAISEPRDSRGGNQGKWRAA